MYAAQAGQCLQINTVGTHRQILPLDQREAEVARQIGMFKIGFVIRAGREQHDQRRLLAAGHFTRRPLRQTILQGAEEIRQMLHAQIAELLGEGARDNQPVFQRISCTGRDLRAVGDHPPAAIRRACEIGCVKMQPGIARRLDPLTRPEKAVMAINQRRRQGAILEQSLLTVEIPEHGIEQARPLRHRTGNFLPLAGR